MTTEKEKMLAGELYNPLDPVLDLERQRCRQLCKLFNDSSVEQKEERQRILKELFGQETDAWIEPPFFCDYGSNISLGSKVFFNFNCVILDVMQVVIGNNVFLGPSVQIYTATHPIDPQERNSGLEFAKPVTIGADVWIGGGAIICPGITIGNRCVIGAGSVVTKDVPEDTVVAGNPCRIIRSIVTS
jgi:maltose O-acetyltransferase